VVARTRTLSLCLVVLQPLAALAARPAGHQAVIDFGSSGIKMLIVDGAGRKVREVRKRASIGQGIGPDRLLPAANQARAVAALKSFIRLAGRFDVPPSGIEVITTGWARNTNGRMTAEARAAGKMTGRAFVKETVKKQLKLARARVVTPAREAALGYRGALQALPKSHKGRFVVIDAGGLTHQVSAGTKRRSEARGSSKVGSHHIVEGVMVDERGAPIDVLGPEDLAAADERMKSVVPALPIAIAEARDTLSVLTGGTAKYLRLSFGKDVVTRGDLEDLRLRVAAQPSGPLRNEVLSRDVRGKRFNQREQKLIGLSTQAGPGSPDDEKLPAKLTLVLRLMNLLGTDELHLSQTDARHALLR